MSNVKQEIAALEERLRQAELGPNAEVFEELLADDAVLVDPHGSATFAKRKVIEAHRPGKGPKFTAVEITDLQIVEHGNAAVVVCTTHFTGPQFTGALKFMRVWLKQDGRWRIVAGSIASA
ncbi:MAG TPA: nuclear transport factor 2 family protein [Burkholderiales bacterium]|nr:nuclear transport factor 2 family protein [Burkholderiales bacterium]